MKLKRFILALLSASMILCMVGCGGGSNATTAAGGEEGTTSAPTSGPQYGGVLKTMTAVFDDHMDPLAPGAATGTAMWARYVYENALCVGLDGKVYPLVCDYTLDDENNPSEIRLKVLAGKKFHDGTDVTIEDVYEPFLLQNGFISKTPRGRMLTSRAYEHLNIPMPKKNTNSEDAEG